MRSNKRILTAAAFPCIALWVASHAAEPLRLNIKPGLWEIASEGQASGAPPVSEETLAQMTPEQRARFQAAMQASMAAAAKPKLFKNCITPEKIAQGFDIQQGQDPSCQRTVTSVSSSEFNVSAVCTRADGSTTMNMHMQLNGSEEVAGTVHVAMSRAGRNMTVDTKIHGKWLGANCGDVTGVQIEH